MLMHLSVNLASPTGVSTVQLLAVNSLRDAQSWQITSCLTLIALSRPLLGTSVVISSHRITPKLYMSTCDAAIELQCESFAIAHDSIHLGHEVLATGPYIYLCQIMEGIRAKHNNYQKTLILHIESVRQQLTVENQWPCMSE